ncbi:PREDICTED: protein EXORDIUM-like 2 [Ipomoea nil]|uniref:protein EXORDIUM-like 2 n=1 Tax=Ipomoea nil TaxID=35883 RepID=UPI000901F1B5|nr:PREDICTED: protein EXORDIUM-like 2 [Ipomoea nil]
MRSTVCIVREKLSFEVGRTVYITPPISPFSNNSKAQSSFHLKALALSIMAAINNCATASAVALLICFLAVIPEPSFGELVKEPQVVLEYHKGTLLKGSITVNLIWYGKFTPTQRSIIVDFLESLKTVDAPTPSVESWWKTTEKYKGGGPSTIVIGKQILEENCSLGKTLKDDQIVQLASKGGNTEGCVNVVLTDKDVSVDGFCKRCGSHGSTAGEKQVAYAWVGNSETQCPGQCAWPFHKPIQGPQTPPLVAPNGDVGIDGMIINLATVLAGTVTNPFKNGYFQGPAEASMEAVSACTGMFGTGSYPGNPGKVLVDKTTGASYNAHGANKRKFLLPAMWDPAKSACAPLV